MKTLTATRIKSSFDFSCVEVGASRRNAGIVRVRVVLRDSKGEWSSRSSCLTLEDAEMLREELGAAIYVARQVRSAVQRAARAQPGKKT